MKLYKIRFSMKDSWWTKHGYIIFDTDCFVIIHAGKEIFRLQYDRIFRVEKKRYYKSVTTSVFIHYGDDVLSMEPYFWNEKRFLNDLDELYYKHVHHNFYT